MKLSVVLISLVLVIVMSGCGARSTVTESADNATHGPTFIIPTSIPTFTTSSTKMPDTIELPNSSGTLVSSACPDINWDILTTAKQRSIAQVFLVNSLTGEMMQLTHDKEPSVAMSWSPDGCEILLSSQAGYAPGHSEIVKLDLASLKADRLTSSGGLSYRPKWSPDGKLIAFSRTVDNTSQVFVMDSDGSNLRQLTFDNSPATFLEWSPDNRIIAYALRSVDGLQDDIHLIDIVSGESTKLPEVLGRKWAFQWSLDGRKAAFFSGDIVAGTGTMYILELNDSKLISPAENALLFESVWSPDGRQLVFSAKYLLGDQDDSSHLYSVDSDTYEVKRFTIGETAESLAQPSFSRDGERFAFRSDFALTVLNLHDRTVKRFDDVPIGPYPVYWRPVRK
jgi:Tol biopolymer transport system component